MNPPPARLWAEREDLPRKNSILLMEAPILDKSGKAGAAAMRVEADESNKENAVPGGHTAITVTAPVPLSYAARSKAALESILSAGNEGRY